MNKLSKPNVAVALLAALLALLPTIVTQAQNETNNWIFGNHAGINFPGGGNPGPFSGTPNMTTQEGSASISDQAGNLLFYTDGTSVWDKTHNFMPGGTGSLFGGSSSTQSALIVPLPGSKCKRYVVFSAEAVSEAQTSRWSYSIVDMTLNGGLGAVDSTYTNKPLEPAVAEKQAAISDGSGGFWVVAHGSAKPLGNPVNGVFYVVHVTAGGVSAPVSYTAGSAHEVTTGKRPGAYQAGSGQMKISPDGKLIACAVGGAFVEVLSFNSATGAVTGPARTFDPTNYLPFTDILWIAANPNSTSNQYVTTPYGLEFSPNSKVLYVTTFAIPSRLFQIDLQTPYSVSRWTLLFTGSTGAYDFGQLQLGPDNKVYAARNVSTNAKISVVNSPDVVGPGCNFDIPPGPAVSSGGGPAVSSGGQCLLGLPTMIGGTFSCSPTPTPTPTPSPTPTPTQGGGGCANISDKDVHCQPDGSYSYTINVANNSGSAMSQVLLTPVTGSTFGMSSQLANLSSPLQSGQSTTVKTTISTAKPGDKVCFFVNLMSDGAPCCTTQVCTTLPQCGIIESPTPPPPSRGQHPGSKRRR